MLSPLCALVGCVTPSVDKAALDADLEVLRRVHKEGEGNDEATAAWNRVKSAGPDALPVVVKSLDGVGRLTANWIRTAADAIFEDAVQRKRSIPRESLEKIVLMKLEGFTNEEIAEQLGCVTRTVERKLERIREKWNRAET